MRRLSKWVLLIAAMVLLASRLGAQQPAPASASVLLEAANQKVALEGDARGAIKIYQDVVARFAKTDRAAAATAMLKMAECYEKIGDPQASKVFEQVVSEYADQATTAAAARARLTGGMPRLLCEECADPEGSISPDGRYMVAEMPYLNGGERAGDIEMLELATNKLTPLQIEGSGKNAGGAALAPVFSPDGRQVAYAWATNQGGVGLRIVPRDPSGKMKALTNLGGYMIPLAWSAAGPILTLAQKPDKTLALIMVSPSDGAQKTIRSLRFSLSPGSHVASLSADGRFVAYEQFVTDPPAFVNPQQGAALDRQIHVMAADGSGDIAVTTGAGVKRWPTWTPNGRHVMYVSNVAGAWDLWATPMHDGQPAGVPVLVKKNVGDVTSMGMTTAGLYYFYEGRSGVSRTMIASVTAGPAKAAASLDSFVGQRPAWSPDGKMVAVSRPRPDGASGGDVVVRTLSTGEEHVFRHDGILSFPFIWLPDSAALLVQIRDAPNKQFWYRLDLPTGEFKRLVQQRGDPVYWTHQNIRTLSADGRTLYFGTYAEQGHEDLGLDRITALDLAVGVYRDVVRLPVDKESLPQAAQDFVLATSPDGRSLAVMHYDPKLDAAHLAVVGVDGRGYHELVPPVQAVYLRNKLVWSRDGRWIYFTMRTGKPDYPIHRVMRVPASGGSIESVGLDIEGLDCFDLSPDGTRLAYSTLRPEGAGQLLWSLDVSWLMKAAR